MPASDQSADREIVSTRIVAAPPDAVFAAFADPIQLARWWGPNGFSNTIHEFDLRPAGRWRLTMRGPDGAGFENESYFVEIEKPRRIVFRHERPMHGFLMTMTFAEESGHTRLTWRMLFDTGAECDRVRKFIVPANEQNFDRLAAHLAAPA